VARHYQRPSWLTRHLFDGPVAVLNRLGVRLAGSSVLEVRGRRSGEWRGTPVNPLDFEGIRYLVSPRGDTQWVRNLRARGSGRLRVGRRVEEFSATEVGDEEKPPLLRAYLQRWAWEVGRFFGGTGPGSSDEELRHEAPRHPVFRITAR
jgi:deazaflavin-dependent oxidoreductase (nitroreductase family)